MTTQSIPLPTPVVRMPRGTAVSARTLPETARNGTGHLNGRLGTAAAFALAALGSLAVTALMRLAL
ncbi:MAG: hypothetical protein ABW058_12365 [Methylobacterium sp.]